MTGDIICRIMLIKHTISFGNLFKRFRLKAEFATLSEFGKALADEGFIYEDSILSRWQQGTRIPSNRNLLLTMIEIFFERGGITSLREANIFLESARQGYFTEEELDNTPKPKVPFSKPPSPKRIIEFVALIGKSKKILRSGWVREKIKDPESVAEHSFQLSVLAMVLADALGVDKEKLIKMALLHDLGEAVTGDIVWSRGEIIDIKKRAEKEEQEKKGIEKVFKIIGRSNEYVEIFEEMVERESQEAKIFWELDKLEMVMQALDYEKEQNKKLEEFFVNADLQIHASPLRKIFNEILKQRPKQFEVKD